MAPCSATGRQSCRRARAAGIASTRCARPGSARAARGASSRAAMVRCTTATTTTAASSAFSSEGMSKLLQRLSDASKSGVYRTSRADEILDAARGSALQVARIELAGVTGKEALMTRIAQGLAFPRWFGGNWDALEDCLSDL